MTFLSMCFLRLTRILRPFMRVDHKMGEKNTYRSIRDGIRTNHVDDNSSINMCSSLSLEGRRQDRTNRITSEQTSKSTIEYQPEECR